MRQNLLFRSSPAICRHGVWDLVPVYLKHHVDPIKRKMLPTSIKLLLQSRAKRCGFSVNCLFGTIDYSSNEQQTFHINGEEISYDLYNASICELCSEGDVDKAMGLLSQMEALGFHANYLSYTSLIAALGSVGRTLEADAIFHEMLSSGRRPGVKVVNALLRSFLRKGFLRLADKVLMLLEDLDVERNQETYEILLEYYVNAGRLEDTWLIVSKMRRESYRLNSFVYSKITELYRDNGMWKKALGIVEEIREMGLRLDKRLFNSIIDTFGKYGELGEALEVFEKMRRDGIKPDFRTWNSLIRWHCKFGHLDAAIDLFDEMQEQGLYPDPKIFIIIITHLVEQGRWDVINKILKNMQGRGHHKSGAIYAVLVDIYGQQGRFQDAEYCLNALKLEGLQLSPSIFCVLAHAYAQQVTCCAVPS